MLKTNKQTHKREERRGYFSPGPGVENLPSNAGDMGLIPGQGTKIPHVAGQLNPHATTVEPMHHN